MIGKIFRYTFIALVIIAIFCFIFKLDDIVGGMPIKAKATNFTTTKPTSVKPVKATTVKSTPVVTPTSVGTTTPKTGTPAPSQGTSTTQSGTNTTNSGTATDCAPNATSQDPCKLGQCFGYPYGICESNPNQGSDDKEQVADPNGPTYDLWGNEFTDTGTLIQASTEQVDPVSGQVNPYYVGN
jgi:hypothetical protein